MVKIKRDKKGGHARRKCFRTPAMNTALLQDISYTSCMRRGSIPTPATANTAADHRRRGLKG